MTPKQLKNSILQRAIEGRLVPQCATDGTADELLAKIRAEKERLIADGKIKREKPLPPIDEKELPFAIPASWRWVRLSHVLDIRDGTHDSPQYHKDGIPLITSKNISNGHLDFSNVKYISKADADKINTRSAVDKDDILFAMIGSIGNPVIIDDEYEMCVKNVAIFKQYSKGNINIRYIYCLFCHIQEYLRKVASGGVQSFISLKFFRGFPIPLPPLAEQKRIVAKIDELMPLIERYERAYNKLTDLDAKFPADLKKSLLQYAIQGKLVPQCAADGTADELLAQIRVEKEQLIADGKIKRAKPLPPIDEKELPFAIPASWRWTRLGEMIQLVSGRDLTPQQYNSNGEGIPYITGASNIDEEGNIIVNRWTKFSKSIAYKDDLLLSCKGTVGKTTILSLKEAHIARQIMSIRPYINIINYVLLFLSFQVDKLKSKAKSMIPGIERKDVLYAPIPLPPLDEQKRIVAKIDELMARVGRLTKVVN